MFAGQVFRVRLKIVRDKWVLFSNLALWLVLAPLVLES